MLEVKFFLSLTGKSSRKRILRVSNMFNYHSYILELRTFSPETFQDGILVPVFSFLAFEFLDFLSIVDALLINKILWVFKISFCWKYRSIFAIKKSLELLSCPRKYFKWCLR